MAIVIDSSAGWDGSLYNKKESSIAPTAPSGGSSAMPIVTQKFDSSTVNSGGSYDSSYATAYSSSSGGSSGGSGGSGVSTTSADTEQVRILRELLDGGFEAAREQRLENIQRVYEQSDAALLQSYDARAGSLEDLRTDTKKAEADTSFANMANRARESGDILAEVATQGVGETDQLRAQLIAARNWSANQQEVNRAFFDSIGSNNAAITELNEDARTARVNLATKALNDQEQVWASYANQMAQAASQLGNVLANPYSDAYDSEGGTEAWQAMADAATSVWDNPGISDEILDWEGWLQPKEERLNFSILAENGPRPGMSEEPAARPEGSTLKNW